MTNLIAILLLHFTFAGVDLKPVPGQAQYNWEKYVKTYPEAGKDFIQKRMDEFGWKFNNQEWRWLKQGRQRLPEYYRDPKKGSNGGFVLA